MLILISDPKTGGYREGFLESGADIADIGAEGADLAKKLVVAVGWVSASLSSCKDGLIL